MFFSAEQSLLLLSTLWASAGVLAQKSSDVAIIGCKEVDCPSADGATSTNCTLAGSAYSGIGVSNNGSSVFGTWVQASGGGQNGSSTLSNSFYYGTSSQASSPGDQICAVFFHGSKKNLEFDGKNQEETQGTCSDAMDNKCIEALLSSAENLKLNDDDDACKALQDLYDEDVDSACRGVSGGDNWTNVSVKGKNAATYAALLHMERKY